MQIRRKLFAVVLALSMLFGMAGTVSAFSMQDATEYIQQILNYYRYYQDDAATDIDCLLYAMSHNNPYKEQDWSSIMDYWHYVNTDMTIYPDVLPDGLPQTDALCIVVMGYALNANGSMRSELIGRLETALASAKKYPNAYILCTGGGTAKSSSRTEAGEMAKWLMDKGIDKNRIIIEDKSLSTVANAINSCNILANEYPFVTHLAIVTSDYHLARSCLLFHTQAILSASKGAPLLCVAANAAYPTANPAPESIDIQAENLSQLAGIPISGMAKPQLSKLDRIKVWDDVEYMPGPELDFQVIAYYDTGLYRDVSSWVEYAGIDFSAAGPQDALVIYQEGDIAVFSTLRIEIPIPETEVPTEPVAVPSQPVDSSQPAETEPSPSEDATRNFPKPLRIGVFCTLLFAVISLIKKLVKIRKQRKAAKEEEPVPLPDDDSPLEYV